MKPYKINTIVCYNGRIGLIKDTLSDPYLTDEFDTDPCYRVNWIVGKEEKEGWFAHSELAPADPKKVDKLFDKLKKITFNQWTHLYNHPRKGRK